MSNSKLDSLRPWLNVTYLPMMVEYVIERYRRRHAYTFKRRTFFRRGINTMKRCVNSKRTVIEALHGRKHPVSKTELSRVWPFLPFWSISGDFRAFCPISALSNWSFQAFPLKKSFFRKEHRFNTDKNFQETIKTNFLEPSPTNILPRNGELENSQRHVIMSRLRYQIWRKLENVNTLTPSQKIKEISKLPKITEGGPEVSGKLIWRYRMMFWGSPRRRFDTMKK